MCPPEIHLPALLQALSRQGLECPASSLAEGQVGRAEGPAAGPEGLLGQTCEAGCASKAPGGPKARQPGRRPEVRSTGDL
eukprot:NODE_8416_length_519_cov_2.800000_g7357_i0.p1 GENE.NODE_8416_length_519_cov_2.800000_g7357_i0~~NODE_8416_length_519_cov_2.800000_g7357_i0.p1  ORF type:complete len:80 (-),score=0.28 NODE_8416_length_519_cov_2.800000_g7357_i0:57-296(-)